MNCKKILVGILSAAMVFTTMSIPAFADDEGTTGSVAVSGVKIAEGKTYDTIQEAYNEIKTELETKAGLVEQPLNEDDFKAFFTDGGKITWTINGKQKVTDSRMFSFGRGANRFGEGRHITEIDIIGGENAVLDLSEVNGTFALPYNWWNVADSANTALKCKNITFDGIKSMPSATYQCVLYSTTYEFDGCTFNGNLYSYQNFDVDMTIKNSTFNAPNGETSYAFMSQGQGGTITLDNNKIYGYTRGINLERETADFFVTNNTIESNVSEPDRGAVQITDGKSFVVTGNTIDVNGGNAFWFHSAAKNSNATYTITDNNIKAPYLVNDETSFGVNDKITAAGNIFNDTDTEKCMKKGATKPTQSTVTAISANGWTTDTDSGIYTITDNAEFGMMRFMFGTNFDASAVTKIGIKYISSTITNPVNGETSTGNVLEVSGNANAVQGDIYGMKTTDTNNYYAAAFITVDSKTYWSAPISCKLNTAQKFTKYAPTTPAGGEN